ncbi:MAG: hypothetical protein ACK2UH_16485, partial [Candidatus Promineifilaceae bacterium]
MIRNEYSPPGISVGSCSAGGVLRIPIPIDEVVGQGNLQPEDIREHVNGWARQHSLQVMDPIR